MSSILDDVIPSVKADHPVLVIEGLDGTGGRGMHVAGVGVALSIPKCSGCYSVHLSSN